MRVITSNQSACIAALKQWKVGALFMEAGTGKTQAAVKLINSSVCDVIVWVAPLRTLSNLGVELELCGVDTGTYHLFGVESIGLSDRIYMEVYNILKGSAHPFLVVDESIKIKNYEAKRTKRMLDLSKLSEYRLILNGTPLTKNLLDLWAQMEFLSPKIMGMTHQKFKNTFCKYTKITKRIGGRSYSKEFITGYENIDYLHSLIKPYVYQCDLTLNVSQLYSTINYTIGEEERNTYNEIKHLFLDDETMELKNNNIFLEMTQKMQHAYCCTMSKFDKVDELFKRIKKEDTIIFCKYITSREECQLKYKEVKVLSYQKEALGLNLQQYKNIIFFDKIWDYALRVQAARRIFRMGQKQNCSFFDLTGNVGLESMIDRNIDKKVSMSEYLKEKSINEIRNEL